MNLKVQWIGFYTLVSREMLRMFRIASQVFLPPVITTILYFLIFGTVIGKRVGSIDGVDYATFIAPGLVMMSVITNAYANVSTSLFSLRFQRSIEELLVSPMHPLVMLSGFITSGVIRGLIVAILVYVVAFFFVDIDIHHIPMTLFVVTLVGILFSLAGFINGILARTFDDVAIVPTFILAPLTYLGGVFYAAKMLPPLWYTLSLCNPIFYMVSALRYVMIGQHDVSLKLSIAVISSLSIFLLFINLWIIKKGTGFRD